MRSAVKEILKGGAKVACGITLFIIGLELVSLTLIKLDGE